MASNLGMQSRFECFKLFLRLRLSLNLFNLLKSFELVYAYETKVSALTNIPLLHFQLKPEEINRLPTSQTQRTNKVDNSIIFYPKHALRMRYCHSTPIIVIPRRKIVSYLILPQQQNFLQSHKNINMIVVLSFL